jgi:hypothetical protein
MMRWTLHPRISSGYAVLITVSQRFSDCLNQRSSTDGAKIRNLLQMINASGNSNWDPFHGYTGRNAYSGDKAKVEHSGNG